MKILNILLLLSVLFSTTGCYGTLRGKVVDAETGAPIEGAVAMAEWTKTKGLGNTYTVSAKVVEAVSDKDGNIELDGYYSPFVDKPDLTIYRKGYVAWNNQLIFPSYSVREGFDWKSGQVFRMEKFKEGYSFFKHLEFVNSRAHLYEATNKKQLFNREFEFENDQAMKEMRKVNRGDD